MCPCGGGMDSEKHDARRGKPRHHAHIFHPWLSGCHTSAKLLFAPTVKSRSPRRPFPVSIYTPLTHPPSPSPPTRHRNRHSTTHLDQHHIQLVQVRPFFGERRFVGGGFDDDGDDKVF